MKFYIFLILFFTGILFSQAQTKFKNRLTGIIDKEMTYDNLQGSPYKYKEFIKGDVYLSLNDKSIEYILNYNAYKNKLEFIEDNIKYTVTNPNKIIKVEINKDVLVYAKYKNYDQSEEGFFFEIIDDYISLYRREIISYVQTQKFENVYGGSDKDKFANKTTLYYLSIYGDPLILIKNKKTLSKLFFDHPTVKSYLKEEKIKLNSEDDLKKFVVFMNNLDKNKKQ